METSQDLQFPFLAFYIEQNCCKYSKSCIRTLWVYSLFEHLTLSRSELGTHGCLLSLRGVYLIWMNSKFVQEQRTVK